MTLRELRKSKGITQQQAANFLEIPLRTYSDYENKAEKQTTFKYKYMLEKLFNYGYVDEENGLLSIEEIRKICNSVFEKYPINFCYLFGSYAKGKATPSSDIDLLVSTSLSGLQFYGLVEELREKLHKKIDLLNEKQLSNNLELISEVLKEGIKIYG